jgi:arsenate reductase-like glutaredoxin family protein
MTCRKAQGFLEQQRIQVQRTVDARQVRLGAEEALGLARRAARVVAAKGAKVVVIDVKRTKPSDEELLAVLLGPSGALRAPTLQVGDTLLVGFEAGAYRDALG